MADVGTTKLFENDDIIVRLAVEDADRISRAEVIVLKSS